MRDIEPAPLPEWGQRAKRVCVAIWPVFVILWLLSWALHGIDWAFGASLVDSSFVWVLRVPAYAVMAVLLVAGLAWAAGSLAAGQWKPKL